MATTITWGGQGGQSVTVEHPRELAKKMRHPTPPRQPIASWAATLAHFEALCNADQFEAALKWLATEYVSATTSDVPAEKLAALKAYIQANLRSKPEYLSGSLGSWRTDGAGA
jgi:hypothetical protein